MNTYAIQLMLYFQSERTDDNRFETFLDDLKLLAQRHSITFGDFESMQLPSADYKISACVSCGHLTVNRLDIGDGIENMLPNFWFYVHRGNLLTGGLTCDFCDLPRV
jgi:hypothetical protein